MDINTDIEVDKERMETVQKNINLHLQRISIECRLLTRYCTNYRQRTWNDNREYHRQTNIGALDYVNPHIQLIDSSILNLRKRAIIIKPQYLVMKILSKHWRLK